MNREKLPLGYNECKFAAAVALGLTMLANVSADAQEKGAILWQSTESADTTSASPQAIGHDTIKVDIKQLLSRSNLRFSLTLPNKESITVVRISQQKLSTGALVWRGKVEGDDASVVTLYLENDKLLADISTSKGKIYRVTFAGGGVHLIEEFDKGKLPIEKQPVLPTLPPKSEGKPMQQRSEIRLAHEGWRILKVDTESAKPRKRSPCPKDKANRIDVMVLYTEAARQAATSDGAAQFKIKEAVDETNWSFSNSQIAARINLVYSKKVDYTEKIDSAGQRMPDADLDLLRRTDDNDLNEVDALRRDYAADIVVLITGPANGSCGPSYSMISPTHDHWEWAFSTMSWECLRSDTYSFAHELGHIMGAGHQLGSPGGVFAYSHGYVNAHPSRAGAPRWRTVMAEETCTELGGCPRVPYWSNPGVFINGDAAGISDEADNHRALNEAAEIVANFMPSCGYPGKRRK